MKRCRAAILVLVGTVAPLLTCGRALADEPAGLEAHTGLGDRVVDYCKQHKGKHVGNGSCTIFAAAALQAAGAQLRGQDDPSSGEPVRASDFNWGELVFVLERVGTQFKTKGEIKDVRPGDIIQFTNTTLTGSLDDYSTYTMSARHHTAIVADVQENGTVLKIYHQGANGRKKVSATNLRLVDLQKGAVHNFPPHRK
jgi:hypothetical protein